MKQKNNPVVQKPENDPELWRVEPGVALGLFQLGMARDEVIQILEQKRLEYETLSNAMTVYVLEMDTKLYFRQEGTLPLYLIEVSNEQARFGKLKVLWEAPHHIFASIPSSGTLWLENRPPSNPRLAKPGVRLAPNDEQLLNSGTLWMKDLGVGFGLTRGRITTLLLCDPADLPVTGLGEFTGAQRHLSERMALAAYKSASQHSPASRTSKIERAVMFMLLVCAALTIGFFGKRALDEKKRWDGSTEVQAVVVAVWPPPPEPFPNKFELSYQDASGKSHQIELQSSDVYGTPLVGDTVPLRYLPEAPQTALGPVAFRDLGFDRFVPYLLGTLVAYVVLQLVVSLTFFFITAAIGREKASR